MQVKKLVDSARERASIILSSHEAELHLLANTLLDKETMSGAQACPQLTCKRLGRALITSQVTSASMHVLARRH